MGERRQTLTLARWLARATAAPLGSRLVPLWLALGFVVVQADVVVDFGLLRRQLTAAPPWAAAAFVAGWVAAWGLSERGAAADLAFGARHAVLHRQPLGWRAWGLASMVVVVPLAAPVGVAAAFWYGPWAIGAVATWWAIGAAAVAAGARSPLLVAPVALGGAAFAAAVHAAPPGAGAVGAALAAGVAIVTAGAAARRPRFPATPRGGWPRPRGVVSALFHRDVLAAWRTEPGRWAAPLLVAPLVGGAVAAMRVNGEYGPRALTAGALVGLLVAGTSTLAVVTAAARALGRRFDPPEWPTTAPQRVAALVAVAAATLAPTWAAAAVAAPPIGPTGHARLGGFVFAVAAGAAAWVAARPGRPNAGTWPYWLAACLAVAVAPGLDLAGAAGAAAVGGIAFAAAARRLERRRGRP